MLQSYVAGCNSFYFYIKPQLTRMKLLSLRCCNSFYFYIKPQPAYQLTCAEWCCNSFYFYIKPQQVVDTPPEGKVVIHSISTSNHNQVSKYFLYNKL